jgi:hypothetical protein
VSLLIGASLITFILYTYIFWLATQAKSQVAVKKTGQGQTKILKRGAELVFTLFATWCVWAIAAFLNYAGRPPPVVVEVVGAIVFLFQPITNFFVLLRVPHVRTFVGNELSAWLLGSSHGGDSHSGVPAQATREAKTRANSNSLASASSPSRANSVIEGSRMAPSRANSVVENSRLPADMLEMQTLSTDAPPAGSAHATATLQYNIVTASAPAVDETPPSARLPDSAV